MHNIKRTLLFSLFLLNSVNAQQITWSKIESPKAFMQHWDISAEDMQKYQQYMELEGKYQHAHLNPLYVLSIISKAPEEKGYFAAKAAKREHEMTKAEIETAWLISNEMEKQGLTEMMQHFTDKLTGIDTFSYLPEKINQDWQKGDELVMVVDDTCVLRTCIGRFMRVAQSLPGQSVTPILVNHRSAAIPDETLKEMAVLPKVQVRNFDPIEHHVLTEVANQLVHLRDGKLIRKL